MLSLTFLIGVFICAVVPVVTTVTDAPVTTPALFQGLVSHQRSMLSSRWLTLATPWFIVNDKTLSKEERHARVKDLGQSIDKLIAALTCDQLTVAENMGMVQVYLILTRFFKKYPSAHNELAVHVPDINQVVQFWQEVFDKMVADEEAAVLLESILNRRHDSSISD